LAVATPARRGKRIGGPAAGVQIGYFDHGYSMIGFGESCHGLEWGLGAESLAPRREFLGLDLVLLREEKLSSPEICLKVE
jgi:hypothetical protein